MNDKLNNNLCYICLCADRKLIQLDDLWKFNIYLQILNDVDEVSVIQHDVLLCWECYAIISKFLKFKTLAVNSYQMLQYYLKRNLDITHLVREPKLKVHKVLDENIAPRDDNVFVHDVKEELENLDLKPKLLSNAAFLDDGISLHSEKYSDDDDDNQKLSVLSENILKKKKAKSLKNVTLNGYTKKKHKRKPVEEYSLVKLNRDEINNERILAMSSENYVNSEHKCDKCIVVFGNALVLKDHKMNKHDENKPYKCAICECTFKSELLYSYHMNKHERRYECRLCSDRFTSKRIAIRHYKTVHTVHSCGVCDLVFESQEELISHEVVHSDKCSSDATETEKEPESTIRQTEEQKYPCSQCDKVFRWKTSLRKHAETHRIQAGEKRTPFCDTCRIAFTATSNLQKHIKTSSKHQIQLKLRKLNENQADDVTETASKVEQIKRDVTDLLNKYACPQCDRRFQWRGNLSRHMKSHRARAAGELKCLPCGRTFSSIATYQQHMTMSRSHIAEEDFKYICTYCGKKFANKTRLKDHVDWEHLKNYVHTCHTCKKVFKSHTSLYLHGQAVHRRGTDHLCDHCGKAFQNRAKLRSHIVAMHTLEQPYRCAQCSAAFSWHSCLSRHVRVVHHQLKTKRRRPAAADHDQQPSLQTA